MIIRRKIYWHAAVIATASGSYDPGSPIGGQKAASSLQKDGDTTDSWLLSSAVDFIYGVKNCKKIPISLHIENDEVLDVDTNGNPYGMRADNPMVAPGDIRFILPPSVVSELMGDPVEIKTAADFSTLPKIPIRYRLFAVYKSGPNIACSDVSVPDSYFSSENIPNDVVPTNDGVSRTQIIEAMGPVMDLDPQGGETGFYVKMKSHDPITRIGCCDILAGTTSSSSSLPGTGSCPTTAVSELISEASEYRMWMVRQNVDNKFNGNPGVAELAYADLSTAINPDSGVIDPRSILWNHAGFINFEDIHPSVFSSLANPIGYANESGKRQQFRIITPNMFDLGKSMPVYIQHIAWDNRGFLWALCSGGFKMLPSDAISDFTTTEGVYRILPGGWYFATSHIYTWGGGNQGSKTAASLIDGMVGKIKQAAAGYVENNSSSYTSFTLLLDEEGFIHKKVEAIDNTGTSMASWPDFNSAGVRFSEIDAGNGIVCAVSNTGELFAWNLVSALHPSFNSFEAAVVAANASTQTYLHCCAALTPSSGLIIASRSSGATVDSFAITPDPSGIVATVNNGITAGGRITRVTAGRSFAAVLYIDSAGVGRVISSGTINSQNLSTVIGTALTSPIDRDVVFIDAGFEFLAVCSKKAGSEDTLVLSTYSTAAPASGFMIPDDLRIDIGIGIKADKVYCGYERMIAIDADGKINCIGSDDYAFTSKNTGSTPGVMGRSISVDLHAREAFDGIRKFAVMAAGMPSDQNNGSVSIFVKFLPDNSVPASTDATVDGEWQFLKKIYADDFAALAGSMVNSEFGYSVCVAGNNDIIVGAPGVSKVCIIRKTGIPNTINYVVHAIISSPSTLEPANRFGHAVKWLPTGSAYGMIAIGAPVIPLVSGSLGGAIVMSAYSNAGVVDARIELKRITNMTDIRDNIGGNFESGQFGYAFDVCIPSVAVGDGAPAVGRYNLAVADGRHGLVLQWNCKVTESSLMQLVGIPDVIRAAANKETNFGYSVAYTSSTRSADDRKQQLAISQFGDETLPSTIASQGDIFILNPSIDASNGTMRFAMDGTQQILNGEPGNLGNFDTSSGLVFGTKIKAESGVMIIQGSIPMSSNSNAAPLRRHAYFVYKYHNEKSLNSEFSEWRLDRFFTDINPTTMFHPDCCVFFKRRIHGHELLVSFPTARVNGTTVGHTMQGKILSIPDYSYPMGCGRRLKDITSEYASVSVKCAAVGRKHQTLVASDGLHYQLPRYVDAKLCTAAPITNDGPDLDETLQIAVSKTDPIDSTTPLAESIYHFGSLASFVTSSSTLLPAYNTVKMPLYSSASKTVRVAEMHWRPFKVLDKPTEYDDPLTFPGDATFKLVCDSTGQPVGNVITGQSGAFCTPHLYGDGTADADIDNNVNARDVINTGQVYYLQGTESSAGTYQSSVVGSVANDIAINPAVNPSNPLDVNLANIEWVPLFTCSSLAQVYQAQYSSDNSNSAPFIKLNPIKWAYYGRYFNNAVPAGFPSFTKRYGLQIFPPTAYPRTLDNDPPVPNILASPLPADPLAQSISQGRKVFWNVLSQKNASNVKGKLKLFYADLYASILQPSYANLLNRLAYTEQNWHRYLSHVTDTVQNVQALQRQSISGITNNPISRARIYDTPITTFAWPTIQFRPALYSNPPEIYLPLNALWATPGNPSSGVILTGRHIPTPVGDIYKQHVGRENAATMAAPAAIWRMTFQDFLGRGAGILLSKRGTRVNSNPIAWPVLRNQLSFNLDLGGYNYWKDTTAAETAPAERTEGFAPGWFNTELGITGDHECLVAGMSVFPTFASLSVPAYGVVSGRLSIVDADPNVNSINSQLGYLGRVHLRGVLDQVIETLSKGFKRRVGIAQAIIHDPPILIMDEPTDGLDPNQKHEVRELIRAMGSTKAIVLSTHILEEVEAVCTRAVVIASGRVVFDGTPEEFELIAPASVTRNRMDYVFRQLTATAAEVTL